jgi:hypothetical protein
MIYQTEFPDAFEKTESKIGPVHYYSTAHFAFLYPIFDAKAC